MTTEKKLPELVKNINPHYHEAFKKAFQEHVYAGEVVFFAADLCTSQRDSPSLGEIGVILFTDRGCIQFKRHHGHGVVYFKKGSFSDFMGGTGEKRTWVDLERSFKTGWQVELPNIVRKDYSQIKGMVPQAYQVTDRNQTYDLLELRVDLASTSSVYFGDYLVFRKVDGETALNLFLQAQKQGGKISPVQTSSDAESVEVLLESLARLHKAGLLTDAEYSHKKQEVLTRI